MKNIFVFNILIFYEFYILASISEETKNPIIYFGPETISVHEKYSYKHYFFSHLLFEKSKYYECIWQKNLKSISFYVFNIEYIIKTPNFNLEYLNQHLFYNFMKNYYFNPVENKISILEQLRMVAEYDFNYNVKLICITIYNYIFNELRFCLKEILLRNYLKDDSFYDYSIFINKMLSCENLSSKIRKHFYLLGSEQKILVYIYNKNQAKDFYYLKYVKKIVNYIYYRYFKFIIETRQKFLIKNMLKDLQNDSNIVFDKNLSANQLNFEKSYTNELKQHIFLNYINVSFYEFYSKVLLFKSIQKGCKIFNITNSIKNYQTCEILINLNNYIPLLIYYKSMTCNMQIYTDEKNFFCSVNCLISFIEKTLFQPNNFKTLKSFLTNDNQKLQNLVTDKLLAINQNQFFYITIYVDCKISAEKLSNFFFSQFEGLPPDDFQNLFHTFIELAKLYHEVYALNFCNLLKSENNKSNFKYREIAHFCYFTKEKNFCNESENCEGKKIELDTENGILIRFSNSLKNIMFYYIEKYKSTYDNSIEYQNIDEIIKKEFYFYTEKEILDRQTSKKKFFNDL